MHLLDLQPCDVHLHRAFHGLLLLEVFKRHAGPRAPAIATPQLEVVHVEVGLLVAAIPDRQPRDEARRTLHRLHVDLVVVGLEVEAEDTGPLAASQGQDRQQHRGAHDHVGRWSRGAQELESRRDGVAQAHAARPVSPRPGAMERVQ